MTAILVLSVFALLSAAGTVEAVQSTLHVVPFELPALGGGTAMWSDAEHNTGSYSVELYAPASSYAAVGTRAYTGTIDDITSLSFWYKHNPYAGYVGPRMFLLLKKGDNYYRAGTNCVVKSEGAWKQADAINGADNDFYVEEENKDQIWGYTQTEADGITPKEGGAEADSLTFAELQGDILITGATLR